MGKILSRIWPFLKIILIVLGIITILIFLIGIYFYNFRTLKTFKVCITEKANETYIACKSNAECELYFNGAFSEAFGKIDSLPPELKSKIKEALDSAAYCDGTCKIKEVRGLGEEELGAIESCKSGEKEISYELKAKDLIRIARTAQSREQ